MYPPFIRLQNLSQSELFYLDPHPWNPQIKTENLAKETTHPHTWRKIIQDTVNSSSSEVTISLNEGRVEGSGCQHEVIISKLLKQKTCA